MANSVSISTVLFTCFLFLSLKETHGRENREQRTQELYHTVKLSSLFPDESCNPSSKVSGREHGATLEVVHKYGPCSKLNSDSADIDAPTITEILERDQARVHSIQTRISLKSEKEGSQVLPKAATLPAKSGSTIGSSNYMVTIGLGTPKKDLSLIFDTGSDFTWTQCQPCARSCYKQQNPIFNPSQSSTYSNISCNSATCSDVASATSATPGCAGSTCVYGIQYGDSSFSIGFLAMETLRLTPNDVFKNFMFGCGENNQGLFKGTAGLLGLGRDKLSVVSQTAAKYGKYFSYCLPSTSSSTGYLAFGKGGVTSKATTYTPLEISSKGPSFYFISLQAISVGGTKLPISPSVFYTAGTVIDSGTVISRFPPDAYSALKTAFQKQMSKYPMGSPLSILDTCYDLTGYSTISVPKITLYFSGGAQMDLALQGILFAQSISQICLAFAGNSDASDIAILGNVQQKTFNVIYDVAGGKIGFGPGGCA